MSPTTASASSASAWITSWGFCHASRFGSSKTCAQRSAPVKRCCAWGCGDWAAAAKAARRKTAAKDSLLIERLYEGKLDHHGKAGATRARREAHGSAME